MNTPSSFSKRIESIDMLRGIAIVFMVFDHVREFFYLHMQVSDPMNLQETEVALFFTRVLTHFCAPIFIFLTGLSAYLHSQKSDNPKKTASKYLFTRGIFLIFLEISIINFAWTFSFVPEILYLQVIWAIGCSMLALSLFLWLPWQALLLLGVTIISLHNFFDYIHFDSSDRGYVLWAILHDRSIIELTENLKIRTSYPIFPWIGVIFLGYVSAKLYDNSYPSIKRKKLLLSLSATVFILFLLVRFINFGDSSQWIYYEDTLLTTMSFFNLTKYPPSFPFVLLTLSGGLFLLWFLEERKNNPFNPFLIFGKVPMFFYIAHLFLLHIFYHIFRYFFYLCAEEDLVFNNILYIWPLGIFTLLLLYYPSIIFAKYKKKSKSKWMAYF